VAAEAMAAVLVAEVTALGAAVSEVMGSRWATVVSEATGSRQTVAVSATVVSRAVTLVEASTLTAATMDWIQIAIRTTTSTAVTGISW
jgi:hypothetical protein